jgi:hypothetical protein
MCDKIFDELLKNGNIKLSHTIPPIEELKKCVYCKWYGFFLHNTNDCNIFHRQIQSAVDEGRLRFQEMKIDKQHVPVDTLGLVDKKVLVRPCSPDKAKGKILSLMTLVCQIYQAGWLLGRLQTEERLIRPKAPGAWCTRYARM